MATQPASASGSALPKESLGRRFKFIWPLVIAVNVSIGAYLYTRTNKEGKMQGDEPAVAVSSTDISTASPPTTVSSTDISTASPPAVRAPVKPIPMEQQRELLKWILEEKRKVKTKDPQQKKQIDEEKALLKKLIRANSIPSL